MKGTQYSSIRIPIGLLNDVDRIIANERLGYVSRNQFCIDAVRKLRDIYDGQ